MSPMWPCRKSRLIFFPNYFSCLKRSQIASPSMFLQVEKDSLYFKGVGGAGKKTYELTMKFLKEVGAEYILST